MNETAFCSWLASTLVGAQRTMKGIPLIGLEALDPRDAALEPLVSLLADIIESSRVSSTLVVPVTHANAA